jgi:hypothetical protein
MNETTKMRQQGSPQAVNSPTNVEELHREEMLDEALRGTFPASDPLAVTEPVAYRVVEAGHRRAAA